MRVLDGTAGDEIPLTRRALLATERTPHHPRDRQLNAERRTITFRPFMDIGAESYRLYQLVEPRAPFISERGPPINVKTAL
jgi:hypothetical protein